MTAILGGITIVIAQLGNVLLRAKHAGDDELMEGHAFELEAIVVGAPDVVEQHGNTSPLSQS